MTRTQKPNCHLVSVLAHIKTGVPALQGRTACHDNASNMHPSRQTQVDSSVCHLSTNDYSRDRASMPCSVTYQKLVQHVFTPATFLTAVQAGFEVSSMAESMSSISVRIGSWTEVNKPNGVLGTHKGGPIFAPGAVYIPKSEQLLQ